MLLPSSRVKSKSRNFNIWWLIMLLPEPTTIKWFQIYPMLSEIPINLWLPPQNLGYSSRGAKTCSAMLSRVTVATLVRWSPVLETMNMHYQACKCRYQILSKFTIVTSEANGRSFQEMNPKSAWLLPRNLRQLLHVLNCPSQIVCYPRSDITITNYTQSVSTTTLEIFDVVFVLYMSNMFALCVILLFLSIYLKKRLGFSQCFSCNLAVWGRINTLKPSDAYTRKCIGSSLVRVMPVAHAAPSPYSHNWRSLRSLGASRTIFMEYGTHLKYVL